MATKIVVDGKTYTVAHDRSTKDWRVYGGDEGGELGVISDGGTVLNVDQRGDFRANADLLKRILSAAKGR